jgi:aquaporin Z
MLSGKFVDKNNNYFSHSLFTQFLTAIPAGGDLPSRLRSSKEVTALGCSTSKKERVPPVMADSTPTNTNRFLAEVFGTFVLVFGVGGALLFATLLGGQSGPSGVGYLGVALALGLSVTAAMFAVGRVSGGHFNPAITLGLALGRRFAWRDVLGYIVAQLIGGLIASSVLYLLAMFGPANDQQSLLKYVVDAGFGSNGFGERSPLQFALPAAIIIEVIATAILVWVFMGATDKRGNSAFAPLAVGFTLVVLNIVAVPVTGGGFNPARSIAMAIYGGQIPLSQVWAFIVFPIVGGLIAGVTYGPLFGGLAKAAAPAAASAVSSPTTTAPKATQSAPVKKAAPTTKPAARATTTKK